MAFVIANFAEQLNKKIALADISSKCDDICDIICALVGVEVALIKGHRPEKSLELESRRTSQFNIRKIYMHLGFQIEYQDVHKLKLIRRLIPEEIQSSFAAEISRVITEACSATKLADSPSIFQFSRGEIPNGSIQFVLLNMRYFASASYGKFLTTDVPITSESADRTQATISTACTGWLSSVGAAVGLPMSGFLISSSIANLCEVILDKLLPTILAFVMSCEPSSSESFEDIILALFKPLMNFFSGDFGTAAVQQSTGLVQQIIGIMMDGQESNSSEEVRKHIRMMSSTIADFVLSLTQSGKQFDSIIRQLADCITEVAIRQSEFICLDSSSHQSFDKLIEALSLEDFGLSTFELDVKQNGFNLSEWSSFMDEIWKIFCSALPAGLARQIYTRVVSEMLAYFVQRVANTNLSNEEEIREMTVLIWNVLNESHKLLFRCAESESEIFGGGLLSNDLQNIHSFAMMLSQCFLVIGAPTEILHKMLVMLRHFGSNPYFDPLGALIITFFDNGELLKILLHSPTWSNTDHSAAMRESIFAVYKSCFELFAAADFSNDCFTNILTPLFERYIYLSSAQDFRINNVQILGVEKTMSEPIWLEALIEFIGIRLTPMFQKICELALDRVIVTEIRKDFAEGLSVTAEEGLLCSLSPDSKLQAIRIVNEIYSSALEYLPPKLLTFFSQQDAAFKRMNETYLPIGGSIAIQIILKSLKQRLSSQEIEEAKRTEFDKILSQVIDILEDESREEVNCTRGTFSRLIQSTSNQNSFSDDDKSPKQRRFQMAQKLRLIQHSDFTALLTMHNILKKNVKLIEIACQRHFNMEENMEEVPNLKPKIYSDSDFTLLFENKKIELSDINWDDISRYDLGLSCDTLIRLFSLKTEYPNILKHLYPT
ncbi:hypothetical protein Aperf_G00000024321 [Anoplocephala perfoliata]